MIRRGACTSARQRDLLAHAFGKTLAAFVQMRLQSKRDQEIVRGRFGNNGIDSPKPGDKFKIFQRSQLVVDHGFIRNPRHHLLCRNRIRERVDAEHCNGSGIGRQ
jgi:hypothetical protein